MTNPTQPLDLERMREVALKATPGDLDTIPKPNSEYGGHETGRYTCPCCGGDGEVEGETFTNFDGVAIGVQFFGIGNEFKNYEEFFRTANPAAVLALLALLDALSSERAARVEAEFVLSVLAACCEDHQIGAMNLNEIARCEGLDRDEWQARALAAEAQVSALQAQVDGLREGIQRAEAWFRDYERQHRAKATPEGNLKADTNEERANYLRALLPQPPADEPAKGGEGL